MEFIGSIVRVSAIVKSEPFYNGYALRNFVKGVLSFMFSYLCSIPTLIIQQLYQNYFLIPP